MAFLAAVLLSKPLTNTEDQGYLYIKTFECPQGQVGMFPSNKGTRDTLGRRRVQRGCVVPEVAWQQSTHTCTTHPSEGMPTLAFFKAS